jgi:hypothetical protein
MKLIVAIIALGLAGCASDPFELAKEQQAAGQAVCQKRRAAGEFHSHVADQQCIVAAQAPMVAVLDQWGQGDIARQAQAERLLAAEQWDQGKITQGEFGVLIARSNANASSAQQARVARAIQAAYAQPQPAPAVVVQPQPVAQPTRMNCTNEAYFGVQCSIY